jgi:hypothetical protein
MREAMWWLAVLVLGATPGCVRAKPRPPLIHNQPLFIIERSKNSNVVHYDARLTADGELAAEEPVIAYWVMLVRTADGRISAGSRRRWPTASTSNRTRR